jgi:acyl-CoA hydrolase
MIVNLGVVHRISICCFAMTWSVVGVACGATSSTTVVTQNARLYPIFFNRPVVIGSTLRITAHSEKTSRTETWAAGRRLFEKDRAWNRVSDLTAVRTVLAIDVKGRTTRCRYQVERFTTQIDGETYEVLPSGQILDVVVGEHGNPGVASVNGVPLSATAREVVDDVIFLERTWSDFDVLFGTNLPQTLGASWPVHSSLLESEVQQKQNAHFAVQTGTAHLVNKLDCAGAECLEVKVDLSGKFSTLPNLGTSRLQSATMNETMVIALPIDQTQQSPQATTMAGYANIVNSDPKANEPPVQWRTTYVAKSSVTSSALTLAH